MAYIYIVRCDDDSLYTGITKDIKKRMKNHAEGSGPSHAKYMRSHTPKEIAALWQTEEYKVAAKLEYAIKKLKRADKERLVSGELAIDEAFPNLAEFEFVRVKDISLCELLSTDKNE